MKLLLNSFGRHWFRVALTIIAVLLATVLPSAAQDDWDDDDWGEEEELPVEVHGFVEGAGAARYGDDPNATSDYVLGEARFRLDLAHYGDRAQVSIKSDFISDALLRETRLDVRQAWLSLRASSWLDMRVGRQILTWGTGDLLFINDLFPKDFVSFFIGRDTEFLKAPSNTIKFSAYSSAVNVDLAWTPVFTPDRYIRGERLSYYSPLTGGLVGPATDGQPFEAVLPDETLENSETALRLFRNVGSYELAAYGYWGFFKQPVSVDTTAMAPTFSPLAVGGASVRGNALGGVGNIEGAYYYSRDDKAGTDPFVPNSQVRGLLGYERELVTNVTLGLQYYIEWLQDYDELLANSPMAPSEPRETRQLVTTRLTWRTMQNTLTLSLFGYVALQDNDTYWRPFISRKWTDNVSVTLGANVMTGADNTFFGQLENNSNIYLRFRYSF